MLQGPQCCRLLGVQVRQTWRIATLYTVLQLFGAQRNGTRWMEEAVVQKHAGHPYVQIKHFISLKGRHFASLFWYKNRYGIINRHCEFRKVVDEIFEPFL